MRSLFAIITSILQAFIAGRFVLFQMTGFYVRTARCNVTALNANRMTENGIGTVAPAGADEKLAGPIQRT
jgi:hypothetical protein